MHRHTKAAQALGIGLAFLAEGIELSGVDEGRSESGKFLGAQRRKARVGQVAALRHIQFQVALACVKVEQETFAQLLARSGLHAGVQNGAQQELEADCFASGIAGDPSQPAVPADDTVIGAPTVRCSVARRICPSAIGERHTLPVHTTMTAVISGGRSLTVGLPGPAPWPHRAVARPITCSGSTSPRRRTLGFVPVRSITVDAAPPTDPSLRR